MSARARGDRVALNLGRRAAPPVELQFESPTDLDKEAEEGEEFAKSK